jgi:hypothetical protein
MMERWLSVDAVATLSRPSVNRETWELHPAAMPATIKTAQPRARLRLFAFKTLSCIAITHTYPVRTGMIKAR